MIKIDLITGFLGAGKTTFIRRYAEHLIKKGQTIGILENDYGAVNVDMMLLQDLEGEQCELEMVAGGCHRDCHRRRFKSKLIAMGMCGYDRVLIEPSGIYDTDEFFDVLQEEPLDRWYEIGNVIAIIDAKLETDLSAEAEYLLASEVANAGCVIMSKSQEASDAQIARTIAHLNHAMEAAKCSRRFGCDILVKSWDDFTEADFDRFCGCGYINESFQKMSEEEEGFQSVCFMNLQMPEEKLRRAASAILRDDACGNVFRVKGFMRNSQGSAWLELNATRDEITLKPICVGQNVLIVIGEHLNEAAIGEYLNPGGVESGKASLGLHVTSTPHSTKSQRNDQ